MNNRKNIGSGWLFSVAGILIMLVIGIGVYVVAHVMSLRKDMTQERLYTLSAGTKAILKKLDTPIQIRLYASQSKETPVEFKTYAQRVEDLLGEYKTIAGNNLEIKKYDPQPDSDAEEKATQDGVEGQVVGGMGEKVYLGLAISMLDSHESIPFLDMRKEKLLEYDLTRAISIVANPQKKVVGVMSGLPIFGEMNPMAMRMGGGGRQDPWIFITQLKQVYTVKEVAIASDKIDDDIQVLVVVYPKAITDKAQYAIDQFVLRGGKLIAFLDPMSVVDSRNNQSGNPMQAAMQGGASLDKLVKGWGYEFDNQKVVADKVFESKINRGNRPESAPAVLSLTSEGVNTNDVATSQLDNLLIPFAGAFTGAPKEGVKEVVLLHSSVKSQIIEKFTAEFSGEQVSKDFVASGVQQKIAIRLSGKFKTAFPDGLPKDPAAKEEAAAPAGLKEGAKETSVVLIGDSDVLFDQFAGQVQEFMGQKMFFPRNGNLNLLDNLVDQMGGDENLIAVRSRATMSRPFTKIRAMQAVAEESYRAKIRDLEKSLTDTQTRLAELQRSKDGKQQQQQFILSPEQQQEILNFRKKEGEMKKDLRRERKNLRQDIDSLENRLKWVNILGMPFLVAASGIGLALLKRKKTAAK